MRKLAFISAVLLTAACAGAPARKAPGSPAVSAGSRPAWVDGVSAEFPRSRYLTGIGVADDQASAMERARGEIAKVFSAQVTARTVVLASEQTSQRSGAESSSSSQDVMQSVRSMSQKVLEGVEIVRNWMDSATRQFYSLAALDRAKALSAMTAKLEELDARAKEFQAAMAAAPEKLDQVKYAFRLRSLLKAREAVLADIRVLQPGAADPGLDASAAADAAAKTLGRLNVAVIMPGEAAARVRPAVISALNAAGLDARDSADASGADIAVECSASFTSPADPDPRSSWKWSRGTAVVSMKDVKTGRIFLNAETSAREASGSDTEARSKAEVSLGKKIASEITRSIDTYFGDAAR